MMRGKKEKHIKPDDEEQSRLFVEKAREIEADEEKSIADELLARLARMPPEPQKKPKEKRRSTK